MHAGIIKMPIHCVGSSNYCAHGTGNPTTMPFSLAILMLGKKNIADDFLTGHTLEYFRHYPKMNTRDMWHKRAMETNDKLHWNAYRFFRQEVQREIRIAEKEHVRSEILNSIGNSNLFGKFLIVVFQGRMLD